MQIVSYRDNLQKNVQFYFLGKRKKKYMSQGTIKDNENSYIILTPLNPTFIW